MKKLISIILFASLLLSCFAVGLGAEELPEEKIPLEEYGENNRPGDLLVMLFKAASHEGITLEDFADVIPEGIEITRFEVDYDIYEEGENMFIWVDFKDADRDSTILVANALWNDDRVMGVSYDVRLYPLVTPGDADGDGAVNMKDLKLIKNYFSGLADATDLSEGADADGDGVLTVKDVAALKKAIAGGNAPSDENFGAPQGGGQTVIQIPAEAYSSSVTEIESSRAAHNYRSHIVSFFGIDSEGKDMSSVGGVIDSYEAYAEFVSGEAVGLPELDEAFFEDNVLVLGYVGSPCCNYEFTTDGVSFDGETLTVKLTLHDEGLGLCAVGDFVVFTAVSRGFAAGASAARIAPTSESGYPPAWW